MASASSTFMWPGRRPATGWMAKRTFLPLRAQLAGQLATRLLRLRHRHAVAGDDDDAVGLVQRRRHAVGVDRDLLALDRHLLARRAAKAAQDDADMNDRFIALHMM